MKKSKYFDDSKSLIENGYYLCMVISIVFIVVQVVIARNSLDSSSQAELTRHTIEQCQYYRVSIVEKTDDFVDALKAGGHGTLDRFNEVGLQTGNVAGLNLEELTAMELIDYQKLVGNDGAIDVTADVITERIDLINELDQLAFIVLNGLVSEKLMYENFGYPYLTCINICAPVVYNPNLFIYNAFGNPQFGDIRTLYDIWWLRDLIEKKEYIAGVYRSALSGAPLPPYIEESEFRGLYDGAENYRLLSLGGGDDGAGRDDVAIRAEIAKLDREIREHERELAERIRHTAIRNV